MPRITSSSGSARNSSTSATDGSRTRRFEDSRPKASTTPRTLASTSAYAAALSVPLRPFEQPLVQRGLVDERPVQPLVELAVVRQPPDRDDDEQRQHDQPDRAADEDATARLRPLHVVQDGGLAAHRATRTARSSRPNSALATSASSR